MTANTVTINGVVYDKHTGMPIAKTESVTQAATAKPRASQHAHSVHAHTQKSATLNRRYVKPTTPAKKPVAATAATESNITVKTTPKRPAATSAASVHKITRFAKHPSDITVRSSHKKPAAVADIAPPTVHPMVQRVAAAAPRQPVATVPKPSHIIKQEAIEKSLSESTSTKGRHKAAKHPAKAKRSRVLRFASVGVALFIVAGYFTYLSMPNLSVRVAAAQAGIDASYPSYRPSGYSLSGPVAFNDGEVSMKFAMNGGNQNFTLTQEKSGWDSAAVQSNYVIPAAGAEYDVTRSGGLTIFSYGKDAAWVNDNILYTIKGDASLTPDQIQRIATSL